MVFSLYWVDLRYFFLTRTWLFLPWIWIGWRSSSCSSLARLLCRHSYCCNSGDQTWDKYNIVFWFEEISFRLKLLSPWPSRICAKYALEKMHFMTVFSFELVVCVFALKLWCLLHSGFQCSALRWQGCRQFLLVRNLAGGFLTLFFYFVVIKLYKLTIWQQLLKGHVILNFWNNAKNKMNEEFPLASEKIGTPTGGPKGLSNSMVQIFLWNNFRTKSLSPKVSVTNCMHIEAR